MKIKNEFKITRGALEEEARREANRMSNQKILLIVLPIIMVAVILVGIFFGYKSYKAKFIDREVETYETISDLKVSADSGELLLKVINSANPVDHTFIPDLVKYENMIVSPLMIEDLLDLLKDSQKDGVKIVVKETYISYEEQKIKYDNAIKKYKKDKKATIVRAESAVRKIIPKAGESESQTGLLVYFTNESDKDFAKSKEYKWLDMNALKYGFIQRYSTEDNVGGMAYSVHYFRYVGKEIAVKMRALNMNFDQYTAYLSKQ